MYHTVVTSGVGTAYPSGAHEFIPVFCGIRVVQYSVFYVHSVLLIFVYICFFCHVIVCPSIYGF
jgi:hypothetical protein